MKSSLQSRDRFLERRKLMSKKYDFSGYATRYNVKCADGRTLLNGCFSHQNGARVPVVFQHNHKDVAQVIGHADLEEREDGMYARVSLNNTVNGQNAREQIAHGDYDSLSIWANELEEYNKQVAHGDIKELSLVLAGANPGAYIDNLSFAHSNGFVEDLPDQAIIYSGEEFDYIAHDDANDDDETIEDILKTLNNEQAEAVANLLDKVEENLAHGTVSDEDNNELAKVLSTLNDEQKQAVLAIVGEMADSAAKHDGFNETGDDDSLEHDGFDEFNNGFSYEEDELMHENLFEGQETERQTVTLDDLNAIVHDAFETKASSLKECFLAHDDVNTDPAQYGIGHIDYLFPDAKNLDVPPTFIKRDMDWVPKVMNGVHHTPFTRVRSMFADITEDDARALGYIKGDLKKEEFFDLQKRETTPQTIYKKQKLDRDDILDITEFSVVVWLKQEMRMMLEEEIARAILIGDGRSASSRDRINPNNVRPIWTDNELFTVRLQDETTYDSADARAKAFIRLLIKNRKQLKGSGNPSLFITEDLLTDMLLLEDGIGHALYDTVEKLATKLRVKEIISVPVMENKTRTVGEGASAKTWQIGCIMVNLQDYNVGADKGGAVSTFEDFDIDYNQEKYLMETRISGALVKPKAALVLEHKPNDIDEE